uniref:Protein kinase domain-containing protein n=1 Tax=Leersia perrieri TaxID=77586 RepID=A0A0D9X7U7_9ORYZ
MLPPRFLLLLILVVLLPSMAAAQQQYEANAQLDCYTNNGSSVLGYTCRPSRASSCTAYLTFRSAPPTYASPITVSYLLNATVPTVAAANTIPISSPIPRDGLLLVPVPCGCTTAGYYQHDAGYILQFDDEIYLTVANDTYQGLTTCQALMAQNPAHDSYDLYPGISLSVPLRCACPSPAQAAAGVRYLVTYLLGWDDDSSTVADRFGADYQDVLYANNVTDDTTVYPFTTMLVPLKHRPKADVTLSPAPAPAPSPAILAPPPAALAVPSSESGGGDRWKKSFLGRCIGIGAGVGFAVVASGALLALFLLWRRRPRTEFLDVPLAAQGKEGAKAPSPWMLATTAVDVRDAVGSLTVYEYAELESATAGFAEERRIGNNNSSVYRAVINGGDTVAAVKRVAGDVGAEVRVLGRISHARLVRLLGLCVHRGYTYLVFELAQNGALSDWIHHAATSRGRGGLAWRQRMQVAFDVADGLNYLHNYTVPPYVHKNLKSSNVLLHADFRATVSDFGLARPVSFSGAGAAQMTSHVVGTHGYLAPEYLQHGLIGPQLDVFAFGVVLLEILSGEEAAPADSASLLLWEEAEELAFVDGGGGEDTRDKVTAFMDARLCGDYPLEVAVAMVALALRCVAREPRARPSMAEVFLSLSTLHKSTLD